MSGLRVLVVDDSLTIRGIMEALLERNGAFQVIGAAADIASAKALMATYAPDVITLDLAMPDVDGFSFLAELSSHPHAPIVVVSSSCMEPDVAQRVYELGAVACFDKALLMQQGDRLARILRNAVRDYYRQRLEEMDRQDQRERALLG